MKPVFIIYDKTESLAASWAKDLITLLAVTLCVYISRGSGWWTFVTSSMLLIFVIGRTCASISKRRHVFHNRIELIGWAINQDKGGK